MECNGGAGTQRSIYLITGGTPILQHLGKLGGTLSK